MRPRHLFAFAPLSLSLTLAAACGSDGDASTAPPVTTPAATDLPGAKVALDLGLDLSTEEHFYDAPYPSDLRLTAAGTIDARGFPNPASLVMVEGLRPVAAEHVGFPVVPVAYFKFSDAPATRDLEEAIPADKSSPVLLLDVDPSSPERGRLVPTIAGTLPEDDYVPANVIAAAARPGFVLRARTRYAFVVLRSYNDAGGAPLGQPAALGDLLAGRAPAGASGEAAKTLYAPLVDALAKLGVPASSVAAATVFTTGDVVDETAKLAAKVTAAMDVTLEDVKVDPVDGASHAGYCELIGKVRYPQFQRGTPPFAKDGTFELGADGLPKTQREETAPFTITLPRAPMPAGGYPLVLYFHGSGGLSTAIVERGTWRVTSDLSQCPKDSALDEWMGTKGCNTPGEGPGFVVAKHGFAMAGSALPVNPERLPGAGETAYLNLDNLGAFRDTFRQGVLEQWLFEEALMKLELPPSVVAACPEITLPAGENGVHFDRSGIAAQGQSMGGMYTNLFAATHPDVKAAVPTGAGGYWSYFITKTKLYGETDKKIAVLLSTPRVKLSFMHPALHLFETAAEASDPLVYTARVAKHPLAGHPVRHIYEPVGKDDSYFPPVVYDAMALGYEHPMVGQEIWTSTQPALATAGLAGLAPLPIAANLKSEDGRPYTGGQLQFLGDGVYDPHALYTQLDAVKYQYGCFLATWKKTGTAVVPAAAPLGTPCPGL
ncbi:MAG: hypothetical protein IT374_15200 [Polyangiaceae bacterium]|nr:hypothetical protein [Polyangiaceae bacterium]